MGNYVGTTWSPAYMDDTDSSMHDSQKKSAKASTQSSGGESPQSKNSNIEIMIDDEQNDFGSLIGSVVSSLAANTILQPIEPNLIKCNPTQSTDDNISTTQSEYEYLQSVFPHLKTKADIAALCEGPHSALSADTTLTPYYQQIIINNTSMKSDLIEVVEQTASAPHSVDNDHDLSQPLMGNQKKKKKKKRRKKGKKGEYSSLQSPRALTLSYSYSAKSLASRNDDSDNVSCICACLSMTFYTLISVLSVLLIFGSLFVDICMAIYVYFPFESSSSLVTIYFVPCLIGVGLTLISYSLNSCCFFIHTDYCGCAGCLAPLCRCLLSLPPFGVIYTLMLIPGVHSLPFHMASALAQYVLNLVFMMTNTDEISHWNWIQLSVGSAHLILSPMFAWIQQSHHCNLTVIECLKLMMLWLCSISPLTILELINIFPVFIEKFTYSNLDMETFVTLICWSILIRFIFAFIFVDEDGSRLSLICFKRLRVYNEKHKKKKKKYKKPTCFVCIYSMRAIAQLILQIFYLSLPLLPTAAATVRLYKKHCIEYAKWNHLCVAVYLVFTYLPMLYLLLGNHQVGSYTWITIAIAYACTVWVVIFLPIYLKKWVTFRW